MKAYNMKSLRKDYGFSRHLLPGTTR